MGNFQSKKAVEIEVLKQFSQLSLQMVRIKPYSSNYLLHKVKMDNWRQREVKRMHSKAEHPAGVLRLLQVFSSGDSEDEINFIYEAGQSTLQEQILFRSLTHSLFPEEHLLEVFRLLCGLLLHCQQHRSHFGFISPQALIKSEKGHYQIIPREVLKHQADKRNSNGRSMNIQQDYARTGLTLLSAVLLRSFSCCFDKEGRRLDHVVSKFKLDLQNSHYSPLLKTVINKLLCQSCNLSSLKQILGDTQFPQLFRQFSTHQRQEKTDRQTALERLLAKQGQQVSHQRTPPCQDRFASLQRQLESEQSKGSERTAAGEEQSVETTIMQRFQQVLQRIYQRA